ncbi:MAG: glycosyltransferase family 2 protein [Faecalispora jeddahensis]
MPNQTKLKDPKISVVIPVYNVEPFVGKCLSTLVHQTFQDFEIIAVNDGSKVVLSLFFANSSGIMSIWS